MSGRLSSFGAKKLVAGVCLLLVAGSSTAQERSLFPGQNQPPVDGTSDALALLLDQNNQLRTELQALRALVEEQGFELRRLGRDSLSRYTNLDERLQVLEGAAVAAGPSGLAAITPSGPSDSGPAAPESRSPKQRQATPTIATPGNPVVIEPEPAAADPVVSAVGDRTPARSRASTLRPAVLSEQQLYQMGYESAINSNFERSVAEFDQYLGVYPEGRFVSNAHYWKGQSFLYLNRFTEAKDAYEIILNQYSDSPKLPDAMYGLGLAYQGLGDTARARQLFNNIKRRYPNTGVANLADTRLLSLD